MSAPQLKPGKFTLPNFSCYSQDDDDDHDDYDDNDDDDD